MGNDLQTERESLDDSQELEAESGACANSGDRSSAETQQTPFSSSVDPPRPLQREIKDPGSTVEASDVTIHVSKPSDESKESVDQPNGQSSQSQLDTQDASMTTPPAEGTPRLVRGHGMLLSDQNIDFNETDAEDQPSQLEEAGSVPPPFPSLTHTYVSPTRIPVSCDTEHQRTNEQNREEIGKNIEQPQLPTVKTDGAIGGREEVSTVQDGGSSMGHSTRMLEIAERSQVLHMEVDVDESALPPIEGRSPTLPIPAAVAVGEDGSSGTGKTGHSTRTKSKHKTVTRKRQHGELRLVYGLVYRARPFLALVLRAGGRV